MSLAVVGQMLRQARDLRSSTWVAFRADELSAERRLGRLLPVGRPVSQMRRISA